MIGTNQCWNCHCKFHGFQELLKKLSCVSEAAKLVQGCNLCQQLHQLVLICLAKRRCQYHIIELTFSLSFHMPYILKCNQLPKLLSSISSCYDKVLWLHSSKFNFWLEGWWVKIPLPDVEISPSVCAKSFMNHLLLQLWTWQVRYKSHNQDSFNSASSTSSSIGYEAKTGRDQCCRTELTCEIVLQARLSWEVVLEPDPRKIGKEGLAHQLGWKCTLRNVRNFSNCWTLQSL